MDDQRLTPEEIYLLAGEKMVKEYDLLNMYSVEVNDNDGWLRRCRMCKFSINEVEFHDGGNTTSCKTCTLIFLKEYNMKNREKLRRKQKEYREQKKRWGIL